MPRRHLQIAFDSAVVLAFTAIAATIALALTDHSVDALMAAGAVLTAAGIVVWLSRGDFADPPDDGPGGGGSDPPPDAPPDPGPGPGELDWPGFEAAFWAHVRAQRLESVR